MIKNVIFDVGRVLIDFRWDKMLEERGMSPEEIKAFGKKVFESPYWILMDYGTEFEEDVIRGLGQIYPEDAEMIRWFLEHADEMPVMRPKVYEKIHELKAAGYRLYILSNYAKSLYEKHTAKADFKDDIDGFLISYMVHMVKPERRIYEELLRRFDLKAEECVFFDDRPDNTNGAIACGIDAVIVESEEQLLRKLDELIAAKKN